MADHAHDWLHASPSVHEVQTSPGEYKAVPIPSRVCCGVPGCDVEAPGWPYDEVRWVETRGRAVLVCTPGRVPTSGTLVQDTEDGLRVSQVIDGETWTADLHAIATTFVVLLEDGPLARERLAEREARRAAVTRG